MKGDFSRITFKKDKQYTKVNMQQGRVQVDADWNEQIDILNNVGRTSFRDVIGQSGAPADKPGFEIEPADLPEGPSYYVGEGRFYVDGILIENGLDVEASRQPHLPLNKDGNSLALVYEPGLYLAYLDVWERHITELDDFEIKESALDGPDTATRNKIIWQVKVYQLPSQPGGLWVHAEGDRNLLCQIPLPAWESFIAPPTGTLEARTKPGEPELDPCMISPGAGYRRLENQLYRVEVHKPGKVDKGATFKWQRDNGTIVVKARDITEKTITVTGIGRDNLLGFNNQQWVEVIDDRHELLNLPGTLAKVLVKSETELTVIDGTFNGDPLTNDNFPQIFNPKVRRWDSVGGDIPITIPSSNEGYIELEDGIEVRFESHYYEAEEDEGRLEFRTGDYWNIPARTLKGDVEWPRNTLGNPVPKLPDGVPHHYSRLAILEFEDSKFERKADCRRIFPPLTNLEPTTPATQPQLPKTAFTWMHGNAVWAEDSSIIRKDTRERGGATFLLGPPSENATKALFHFPLSISFALEKGQPSLTKVQVVYDDYGETKVQLAEIILFDGPKDLAKSLDPTIIPLDPRASISMHSSGNKILSWNIDPPIKLEFGLGVSVSVNFHDDGQVSFSSVGAEFKLD